MLITTDRAGQEHFNKWKGEIEETIKARSEKDDTEYGLEDFCIFVRDSGYMVLTPEGYERLKKSDKKKIDKWYDYRQIAEVRNDGNQD